MAVDLEMRGQVAVIVINYPEQLNALSNERLDALLERFNEAVAEAETRAIVLTGAGDRAFVAGADIKAMATMSAEEALVFGDRGHALARAIETAPVPVIAAVNGFAFGGGCELALACDIRIASDNAVFAQPEVGLGIPPGWGGTQRLPRVVAPGIAAELIFTGRRVSAEEALRIGLVNAVYPAAEMLTRGVELGEQIARNSSTAVRDAKQLIAQTRGSTYGADLAREAAVFAASFGSPDQVEGMGAFVQKRAATFAPRSDR